MNVTLYTIRDERDGVVHLASGIDPLGTMLCGAMIERWYPVKAHNVGRNVCHRCLVTRDRGRRRERGT